MAEKTEKKLTGLQMPLNISPELAKIIGTKKGEQVNNFFECWQENFNFYLGRCRGLRWSRSCGHTSRKRTCRTLPTSSSSLLTKLWRESLAQRGRSVSGCPSTSRSIWSTLTSSRIDAFVLDSLHELNESSLWTCLPRIHSWSQITCCCDSWLYWLAVLTLKAGL